MKTILVPTAGSEADEVVFETALGVAKPLGAHVKFLHIHLQAGEAALHMPHMEFARGAALANALDELTRKSESRARVAKENVLAFCKASNISMLDTPCAGTRVSAEFRIEEGDALQRLVFHARHNDLVVMGRPKQSDGLPRDRLEALLMNCGRPLLVAASHPPQSLLRTVLICWNESAHAARAVSAALPILAKAKRVVVGAVNEGIDPTAGVTEVVRELQWHGIETGWHVCARNGLSTANRLARIADECGASLLVMGGYRHGPTRETLFGGCTHAMLEGAELPVILLH
jgi:nucleotide-binding universal stress UspA family protein